MPDRLILAIETTLARCSVALVAGERVWAEDSVPMVRGHAESLAPMVRAAVGEAGVGFEGIGRIAVTTGPGSFTGVRVGLAFARGLALALDVPIVGLSSLEVLALGEGESGWRAGAIPNADGVFFALFEDGLPRIAPSRLAWDEALACVTGRAVGVTGPAAGKFAGQDGTETGGQFLEDAPSVVALARLAAGRDPAAFPAAPLYLRAALA